MGLSQNLEEYRKADPQIDYGTALQTVCRVQRARDYDLIMSRNHNWRGLKRYQALNLIEVIFFIQMRHKYNLLIKI